MQTHRLRFVIGGLSLGAYAVNASVDTPEFLMLAADHGKKETIQRYVEALCWKIGICGLQATADAAGKF